MTADCCWFSPGAALRASSADLGSGHILLGLRQTEEQLESSFPKNTLGTLPSGLPSTASVCFLWTCVLTSPSNDLVIGQFSSAATCQRIPMIWRISYFLHFYFSNSGFRMISKTMNDFMSVISIPSGSFFKSVDDLLTSCDGRRSVAPSSSSSSLLLFRFIAGGDGHSTATYHQQGKNCLVFKQQVHSTVTHTSP